MKPVSSHITAFLCEHLPIHRGASDHTCDTYAYAFKLLFEFASRKFQITPSQLCIEHLDVSLILEFLIYLESERGNSPRTRNARLASIKSFMCFLEFRIPSLLQQISQIKAIPAKKTDKKVVNHLSMKEIQAILDVPDLNLKNGIRDRAMIHLCFAAGLRVSELITLPLASVTLNPNPNIKVLGKGRKERCLPLWKRTVDDIRTWINIRNTDSHVETLFVNLKGLPMSRSGFEYILRKHVKSARKIHPTLLKKQVSPHTLRHTCAVMILRATGDLRRISLWLGHEDIQTTQIYLRSDAANQLDNLESMTLPSLKRGSFQAADRLIASLQNR